MCSLHQSRFVNENVHLVNEKQTLTAAVKAVGLHVTGVLLHTSWVPRIRELAAVQRLQQIPTWTPGIRKRHNRRPWPLNSPRPQIEWHPFNCRAETAMEQEIMEDITPWSCAKPTPSQGAGEPRAYNTREPRLCSSHHFHAALRWFPNILSALRRDKPILPKHGCHAYKPFTALKNPLWLLHKHGDSKGHFAQAHLLS